MARWDWYQSTIKGADVGEVAAHLLRSFDLADLAPGRAKNGYQQGACIKRGDRVLAEIWWGGNPGVHVKGTGEDSPAVCKALQPFTHQPTRVDACEDWIERGLFNRLSSALVAYAEANRISINQQGDWIRGEGRTLYLGSKHSTTRLVLYEKGYQVGGDPDWVRLEVRVRPDTNRDIVAHWQPGEAFGASRWLTEALASIGWDHLQLQAVGTIRTPTDTERQRSYLLKQYGRIIENWAQDVGGWEKLGVVLQRALVELSQ